MSQLGAADRACLLAMARRAIDDELAGDAGDGPPLDDLPARLVQPGACFVTLKLGGALRGCVGSIEPRRPLAVDVAKNARAAAFSDTRFARMTAEELARARITIAILGRLVPMPSATREDFERALRPGVDGAVLAEHGRRATFLPAVWAGIASPREFVDHLLRKLGVDVRHWSAEMAAWSYEVESFGDDLDETP